MTAINIRTLSRSTRHVLESVEATRRPIVVFNRNRPVAVLMPLDADAFDRFALQNSQDTIAALDEARRELAEGTVEDISAEVAERASRTAAPPLPAREQLDLRPPVEQTVEFAEDREEELDSGTSTAIPPAFEGWIEQTVERAVMRALEAQAALRAKPWATYDWLDRKDLERVLGFSQHSVGDEPEIKIHFADPPHLAEELQAASGEPNAVVVTTPEAIRSLAEGV